MIHWIISGIWGYFTEPTAYNFGNDSWPSSGVVWPLTGMVRVATSRSIISVESMKKNFKLFLWCPIHFLVSPKIHKFIKLIIGLCGHPTVVISNTIFSKHIVCDIQDKTITIIFADCKSTTYVGSAPNNIEDCNTVLTDIDARNLQKYAGSIFWEDFLRQTVFYRKICFTKFFFKRLA